MSYAIPHHYEPQIEQVAQAQRISADEAVDRILRAGLEQLARNPASRIPGLTGNPMSDEEAAVMDEVVETAMNSRSQRWTSDLSA